ncbi:MAG TPA: Si-specific NAD(P)(+) transhydrogenase [Blastocatellia bacterium]|nr:Si-specific NAD(P)(+) transhydrogenase [Blastocatellia bacterium]
MEPEFFDLVVIGAGPAGEKGANTAAIFGKRVAIIEKAREVGGAVANTGTLPSKTLRETALALSGLKARNLYGVDLSLRREATVADFMHHEQSVAARERARIMHTLLTLNIQLYQGTASFVDSHTIRVSNDGEVGPDASASEKLLRAEKILIATGSSPFRPPEFAFEDDRIHDSDEILTLDRLPKTLAVVGAGVIGSEYACTFAALGTKVDIIDGRDSLLPFLDVEVSNALLAAMQNLGILFHWKERVTCEAPPEGQLILTLSSGKTLKTDGVLIAAGRSSNTEDLNLDAAGITAGKRGLLTVNANFQTEVPNIYAAGDVIGFPALAATGMEQARVAMCHACDKPYKTEIANVLPTGIYTIPEISTVGETEESLKTKGVEYVVGRARYDQNARGQIIGDQTGFLKLLFNASDMKVLGVHVIGEHATELLHVGLMAMLTGSGVELFNQACFNYPTLGDLYKYAAYDAMVKQLAKA